MNEALFEYIKTARDKGHTDEQIKADMTAGGWDPLMVASALESKDDLLVPPPPPAFAPSSNAAPGPQAVAEVRSTRGLEYTIMFISLAVAALSLGTVLHTIVNNLGDTSGYGYGGSVSFAASALIVSLPIFLVLFLRLKKAEQEDPNLWRDPSRRKGIQTMLILTFLAGLINIVAFMYSLLNGGSQSSYGINSSTGSSVGSNFVHLVITLLIAGGIFAYYWHDEHKAGH